MSHTDIKINTWITAYVPEAVRPYIYLARLDRPIGIWLLLLPALWSIFLAAGGLFSLNYQDVILISMMQKTEIPITAHLYYELGERFYLHWLRKQARYMRSDGRWSAEALEGMVEQFYNCQAGLTVRILKDMKQDIREGSVDRKTVIDKWINSHVHQAHHIEEFFEDMRKAGTVDLSILTVAEHRLRQLYWS